MTAHTRYWADWFWNRAGGRCDYPADIGYAALCALEVAIVDIDGLTPRTAAVRLARFGVSLPSPFQSADRPLRGCIAVGPAGAAILLDEDDSDSERRFTIAHEVSHYILEVRAYIQRAERMMGGDYLAVIYGSREPTDDERLDAWLKRVRSTPYTHFMDRAPDGGYSCGQTLRAECDADSLAVQILAPHSEMARIVRDRRHVPFRQALDETARIARHRFGLPPSIARDYAGGLAWSILGGPAIAERFGLLNRAAP